ncbi:RNA polymerase sigma factor [Gordonia effusa]|nr:RNA polymerase sigma factor [Gordonia effusa]
MRARGGDSDAFEALAMQLRHKVYGVCMAILYKHQDAEDACQETDLAAWQHLHSFRGNSRSFPTWFFTIAANKAREMHRQRRPVTLVDWTDTDHPPIAPTPDFSGQVDIRQAVQSAIADLPEDFSVAFILFQLADLPVKDIAEWQKVSEATVKTRLFRARTHIRDRLREAHDATEPHNDGSASTRSA